MAKPDANDTIPATETATAPKSIVPSKYAGKYKGGGSGVVPEFIKSQAYTDGNLVLESFFSLCTVNEIPADKVDHYRQLVADKAQGSAGKARMTLGNMLAAKARKQGFLLDQSGKQVPLDVPKPALGGAAAKAAEAKTETADTVEGSAGDTVEGSEADDVGESE